MTDDLRALVERIRAVIPDCVEYPSLWQESADALELLAKEQQEDYALIESHAEKLESLSRELAEARDERDALRTEIEGLKHVRCPHCAKMALQASVMGQRIEELSVELAEAREDTARLNYVLAHGKPYSLGDPPDHFAYSDQLGAAFDTVIAAIDAARAAGKEEA